MEEIKEKTKEEEFAEKYNELCKETGYIIVPSLAWFPRDDGTWSTKVSLTINKSPKENK